MSRDRLDDLAAELFAAAREEGPDGALVEQVQRATALADRAQPPAADGGAPTRGAVAPSRSGRRSRVVWRGLLAAIVGGGVVASLVLLLPREREGVIISAERATGGSVEGVAGVAGVAGVVGVAGVAGALPPGVVGAASREGARSGGLEVPGGVQGPGDVQGQDTPAGSREDTRASEDAPREKARVRENALSRGNAAGGTDALPRTRDTSDAARQRATTAPSPSPPSYPSPAIAPEPTATATATAAATATATATATLSHELGALKQIRQALRQGDGAGALALLDRYDSGEYGKRLSLEARVLRLQALDAVGRRAEAEALARRFVQENPDSPLAERAQSFIDHAEPAAPASEQAPPASPARERPPR